MANQDKLTQKDWALIQAFMDNTVRDNTQKLSSTVVYEKLGKKLSTSLTATEFQPMLSIAVRAGTIKGYKGCKGRYGGYMRLSAITPIVALPEVTKEEVAAKPVAEQEAPEPEPAPAPEESEPDPTEPQKPAVDPEGDTEPAPAQAAKPTYSTFSTPVPTTVEGINKAAQEREAALSAKAQQSATRPFNVTRTDIPHQAWKRVQRLKVMVEDRRYEVPMAACDIRELVTTVLQGEVDEHGPIEVDGVCYSCSDIKLLERFLQCFFESTLVLFSTDHPEYVPPYSSENTSVVSETIQ